MPHRLARLASVLFLAGLATPVRAQLPGLGAVEGGVSAPEGPVAGAAVRLVGADRRTTTDQFGQYRLDDVPPGSYALEIAAVGFTPTRRPVRIVGDSVVRADVALARVVQQLADLNVTAPAGRSRAAPMPDVAQGVVYAGRKVEVIELDSLDLNAAQDVSRQLLARVPGLNVAETGGAGFPSNGIGFRGLNASQSVEVNVRQDGYNIAADPYGYPEAYFLPPAEALERVELVRGAPSLGFGSQFGGMVNYVIRDGSPGVPVARSRLTGASYATLDGFGDVGGGLGPLSYYGFAQFRTQDGWRPNGDSRQVTGFGRLRWRASPALRLGLEYTLFRNRIHMPGGLTDEQFNADPSASYRARNWLGSPWNVLALMADYTPSANLSLRTTLWGSLSQRYLVWRNEAGGAGTVDSLDPATGQFVPREVERERFTNATLESRLTWSFPLLGREGTLVAGVRAFAGRMHRQEGGPGSRGSDFDLTLYGGPYENDVTFGNTNLAAHAERLLRVGDRLTLVPGVRIEYLHSTTSGHTDTTFSPLARNRTFALPGTTARFRTSATTELYGSAARSYRAIDYSSLTPFASVSRIDPGLKDPNGYTTDLGWRGRLAASAVTFDVSVFRIHYGNRIGLVSGTDPDGTPFTLRTNVGTSIHRGVETFVELRPFALFGAAPGLGDLSLFNAFAFTDAKYADGPFAGNRVEYAPRVVNRAGVTYARGVVSGTFQVSHVSEQFGDANNTVVSSDANVGLVPAYAVLDLSLQSRLGRFLLSGGVNNLADAHYFTRRTDEYPGPGIIPSPGRSLYVSLGADF